jgi:hypothetical protein
LPAQGCVHPPLCNSAHRGQKPYGAPKGLVRAVATEQRRTDALTSSLIDASEPAGARTRSGDRFRCSRAGFVGLTGLEPAASGDHRRRVGLPELSPTRRAQPRQRGRPAALTPPDPRSSCAPGIVPAEDGRPGIGLQPGTSSLSEIEGSALCGPAFPQVAGERQG